MPSAMMNASILGGILVILCSVNAQNYFATPAQEKTEIPNTLGKYFVYVNCSHCDVDSGLFVMEAEGKNTTVPPETAESAETTETTRKSSTTQRSKAYKTTQASRRRKTNKFRKNKPMREGVQDGEGKRNGGKYKGRDRLPGKPKGPKPGPPRQHGKPKRPSTKGNLVPSNEYPPHTEEYINPYLPKDKQDYGEDSIPEYSFYEDPSFEDSWPEYSITEEKGFMPDYPFNESPSKNFRTEEYVNPYLPEDKKPSDELLRLIEYLLSDYSFNDEYDDSYLPEDNQDSGEGSWHDYPFKESDIEEYVNPYLPKDKPDSSGDPWYTPFPPVSVTPVLTRRPRPPAWVTPVLTRRPRISVTPVLTRRPRKMATPAYADSPPEINQIEEYVNPFLPKDIEDSGDYYDDDENPDLQYFKKLMMKKYENSVYRYADLPGIPDEKVSHDDSVFCVYETVKGSEKILQTLDYSFQKPCKILSSPANKVNMTALFCHNSTKSRVCLMRVECPPPTFLKSKVNKCDDQIIIRRQNIIKSEDKKNSEDPFKRQDVGYKTGNRTEKGTLGSKILTVLQSSTSSTG